MRIISFLFVVSLLVQDNSAVQISGIVVDAAGQPISGVMVKLVNERALQQFGTGTRSDGRFVLSGLPPGRYIVRAEKAGFQQKDPSLPSSGIRYPGLAITVVHNRPVKDIRLQVTVADSIVSGQILDENRQPLGAVQVVLLERIYDPSGSPVMSMIAGGTVRTDENGDYRISGLGNGDYYLRVEPDPTTPAFLPTYYPGGTDPARAIPITVSGSGQIRSINLSVFRGKGYTIRMKLASAAPIPPTLGFTVLGVPGAVHQAIGDDTHLFEKVPPGSYNILMSCPQRSDCAIRQLVHVDVDRDVDLGMVVLKPGVSITGRVVTNATLPERFAGRVVLDCARPPELCTGVDVSTDGTFRLGTVREGRYHLWVRDLPAGLYISAVRYGGKDVLGSGVVVDGAVPQPLEVVISGPPGGIEGVVRDGKGEPVPNTGVVLVPSVDRRGNPHLYFLATTDQSGSFSIFSITPGDYSAFAWETAPNNAYRNAGWLKEYESQALRITVRGGLQTAADLRLIPSRR